MRGTSGRFWGLVLGGIAVALLTSAAVTGPARAEPVTGDQRLLADYDALLARNPNDRATLIARAQLRTRSGDINGAIADYGRAASLKADAALYRQRAALLLLRTDYRVAITDLDQAVRLDPRDGAALLLRGEAREALGAKEAALSDYRQALARDPQNPDARAAASRLAEVLPPQPAPAPAPDVTGSLPPVTQPEQTQPEQAARPRVAAPMATPPRITSPQTTPLRIVRGGIASDARAGDASTPGIYHLPAAAAPTAAAASPRKTPSHQVLRTRKPAKPLLRREARNRAAGFTVGFNDAFGGGRR